MSTPALSDVLAAIVGGAYSAQELGAIETTAIERRRLQERAQARARTVGLQVGDVVTLTNCSPAYIVGARAKVTEMPERNGGRIMVELERSYRKFRAGVPFGIKADMIGSVEKQAAPLFEAIGTVVVDPNAPGDKLTGDPLEGTGLKL